MTTAFLRQKLAFVILDTSHEAAQMLAMTKNTILCTRQAYVVPEKLAAPLETCLLLPNFLSRLLM